PTRRLSRRTSKAHTWRSFVPPLRIWSSDAESKAISLCPAAPVAVNERPRVLLASNRVSLCDTRVPQTRKRAPHDCCSLGHLNFLVAHVLTHTSLSIQRT